MSDVTLGQGDDVHFFARGRATDVNLTDFGSTYFSTFFTGGLVVPPVSNPANGNGSFVLNKLRTRLDVTMDINAVDFDGSQTAANGDNVISLAFRNGVQGSNGPVVWGLIGPDNDTNDDTVINAETGQVTSVWNAGEGNGTTLTAQLGNLLIDYLYVDVRTNAAPSGAARGQVRRLDDGADKVDVTGANIGELSTLLQIMVNFQGAATIAARIDNEVYVLSFEGILASQLKASDFIFAGNINETINGTANGEDLFGAGGNDKITAGAGADRAFGESGNDNIDGGGGKDVVSGGSGADSVSGGAAADLISGVDGADILIGAGGADRMFGASGVDVFNSGPGRDTMAGGSEADVFAFTAANWGGDLIGDYQDGVDKLRFKRSIADSASDFTITGNNTTDVTLAIGAQTLSLHGAAPILINGTDFQFIA